MQILAAKGIGLPVTGFAHSIKDIDGLVNVVGGAPLVVKLLEGTQGIGVVLAETKQAATSVIEAFRGLDVNILVQEFIKEAEGADIRAFVVGDRVVAAMKRQGAPGEFRSNLHRGGKAEKIKLTPEERSTAVRAAQILGLKIAGVDILRSNHGPVVLEVNSSPGLEGIEKSSERRRRRRDHRVPRAHQRWHRQHQRRQQAQQQPEQVLTRPPPATAARGAAPSAWPCRSARRRRACETPAARPARPAA
jgi:RimK family alpha-L-glutamate ligase